MAEAEGSTPFVSTTPVVFMTLEKFAARDMNSYNTNTCFDTTNLAKLYTHCSLCPRTCGINRFTETGFCRETHALRAARAALHTGEEPPISGTHGSGAIFFCGCTLRCKFCQNEAISVKNTAISAPHDDATAAGAQNSSPKGSRTHSTENATTSTQKALPVTKMLTPQQLAAVMLNLQAQGAHNINLVTGTQFVPTIIEALGIAREKGLEIPIVWNTSGYESLKTLEMLAPYVDVWLPDFKYASPRVAASLSGAHNYPQIAQDALLFMAARVELQGGNKMQEKDTDVLQSGLLVRHLCLPAHTQDSINCLKLIKKIAGCDTWISLMNQYTPNKWAHTSQTELAHTLSVSEYEKVKEAAYNLGFTHVFFQEEGTQTRAYIPAFDGCGLSPSSSI